MSLERTCYLCGRPVSIRRRMSLFCSDRCEARHRTLTREPEPAGDGAHARLPEGRVLGAGRGGSPQPFRP